MLKLSLKDVRCWGDLIEIASFLEWARLFPEKISHFLVRMATDPGWQISFRGLYDCLRLLYLRLFNEEARIIEMM